MSASARVPGTGESVAHRALRGALALGVRQVVVQGANLLGVLVLARLLAPADFGAVAIALFLHGALASVALLGLGTSLVREPSRPTLRDERTVLAAQQALALVLGIACWYAAPSLAALYGRPETDVELLRAVALAAPLAPLQTVPVARLERGLRFARLATVEATQALAYNATAVALAWQGWGTRAVAVALLARAVLGALLASIAHPWRVGWALDRTRLAALARFGIPFQAVAWLSLVKDALTPILIGLTAGAAAVGWVDWAQTLATYPTLALMILQRVYVPAFARVRDEPRELSRLVERSVQAANALAAPIATITLALFDPLVGLAFGERWRGAQVLFYWLWCANLVVPTVTPLVGLLNALGRARTVLALAVAWTAGTWLLGAPLVLLLGPVGFGVANLLVQLTAFWVVRVARAHVALSLVRRVVPVWACAAAAGGAAFVVARLHPPGSLAELAALAAAALLVYVAALAVLMPSDVRRAWAVLRGYA